MTLAEGSPDLPLYRAIVEYDGTDLLGFQLQAHGRTVQGELEQVFQRLTQHPVRVIGSGRTDTGVHARGQVIAFRARWNHSLHELHRATNALLPSDISVQTLDLAPNGFQPRFSAIRRWYRYQIGLWPYHSPLRARYAWELSADLDVEAMNVAASHLIGEHDFATFGQATQGDITVRTIYTALWHRQDPYLIFDIIANAFLRRMVRNIVGTLVQVGIGRRSPSDLPSLLERRDLSLSAPPAPPHGLFLQAVTYPNDLKIHSNT